MASRSSRHRRAPLYIDDGLLRSGRQTLFHGQYPRLKFQERTDNKLFRSRRGDTLDHLATVFYRDPALWWIIADFQPEDAVPLLTPLENIPVGTLLYIPSMAVVRSFFSLE